MKSEINIESKKYPSDSAIHFNRKSILRPIGFTNPIRQRESVKIKFFLDGKLEEVDW